MESHIISYNKDTTIVMETGYYYNEDNDYYEIWGMSDVFASDPILMAKLTDEDLLDPTLMEVVSFWTGRYDEVLKHIIKH